MTVFTVSSLSIVMPRLGLGVHEFLSGKLVDARPKARHDDRVGGDK